LLREYDKNKKLYTGRELHRRIICVLQGAEVEALGVEERLLYNGVGRNIASVKN